MLQAPTRQVPAPSLRFTGAVGEGWDSGKSSHVAHFSLDFCYILC